MISNGHAVDFEISMVSHGDGTKPTDTTFRRVMEEVASPKWERAVAKIHEVFELGGKEAAAPLKFQLPAFLFSGRFSYRNATNLKKHSGLICADLDGLGDQLEGIRDQIVADDHVLGCFRSPTGSGLKVIFRCDPEVEHIISFRALEHYMLHTYGIAIDSSCKDVVRLCYASHDPEAFVAENAEIIPYPAIEESKPIEYQPVAPLSFDGDLRPGDAYDQSNELPALLQVHGWTKVGTVGWRRPGKDFGISATFNHIPNRFWVWTSSTQFEPQHLYQPWCAYAVLEHGGNLSQAAKALYAKGFGVKKAAPIPVAQFSDLNLDEPAPALKRLRPLSDFALPPDGDPSVLLGNRYLNRGDGGVLVGTSGMGKSAMSLQMAITWALGRDAFGIKPNGPLRSLIIQSEDSDGDIAEMWYSMSRMLKLTPEEIIQVDDRVRVVTERVYRGDQFVRSLKDHIDGHKPDLVWVNPLQAFMDGDVTDSQDLGNFLRGHLNRLNNEAPTSFAYILVHHTTKPSKDRQGPQQPAWHEVMYDMAGGAEIINWARAILSLRAAATEGDFNLVLAKRGRRAGVTKWVTEGLIPHEETQTVIPLRHARGKFDSLPGRSKPMPIIFWEARDADVPEPKKSGPQAKYKFSDYQNIFPAKNSAGLELAPLHKLLGVNKPIEKNTLFKALERWALEGMVEIINPDGKGRRYRAVF